MNGNPDPTKDGHTDIAHPIAQEWARYRLSGEEWQVLWVIIEKTWGWHKSWDNISLKQFYEATEMKKPSIIRAIKKLIDKNIVSKRANRNLTSYHINSHFNTWKSLAKKLTLAKELMTVSKTANDVSKTANKKIRNSVLENNLQAPKETITKETITKESTTSIKPKITFENDKFQNITEEKIQKWKEAFPNCIIEIELKKMEAWLIANPIKHKKNYERFIVNWLSRSLNNKKGGKDGKYISVNSIERKGGEANAGEW